MAEFWNPCGGRRWRTLADGRIEVEGRGVPEAEPGTRQHHLIGQTWLNWQSEFRSAGKEFGIPPAMLAAIAYVETGFVADHPEQQASIRSGDQFGSIGIMQPIPSTTLAHGFTLESRYDPLQNIRLGAMIARENAERYGLDFPSLAAAHNAGSRRCQSCPVRDCNPGPNQWNIHTYSDYLGVAIPAYNTLLSDFEVRAGLSTAGMFGVGLAVAGIATAVVIATGRPRPVWRSLSRLF